MRQHDVRPDPAKQSGQPLYDIGVHEEDCVVGSEEVNVLESQYPPGPPHLLRLDLRPLGHQSRKLVAGRYLRAVEHGVADHLVVDSGPVREHHAGNVVAPRGVVGHRAPGLVEHVRGVSPNRHYAQRLRHALSQESFSRLALESEKGRQAGSLFPLSLDGRGLG